MALRQAGATELCCCPAPPVCLVMCPSLSAPGGQTGIARLSICFVLFGFVSDTDTICQTKKKHKQIVRR